MHEIINKVIKELEHVFDVLSSAIKNNKEDIQELRARILVNETRIKELEDN